MMTSVIVRPMSAKMATDDDDKSFARFCRVRNAARAATASRAREVRVRRCRAGSGSRVPGEVPKRGEARPHEAGLEKPC